MILVTLYNIKFSRGFKKHNSEDVTCNYLEMLVPNFTENIDKRHKLDIKTNLADSIILQL